MESTVNVGNPLSIISRKAQVDRINFVNVWIKLDLYWHSDSTSENVIESPESYNNIIFTNNVLHNDYIPWPGNSILTPPPCN